MTTSRSILNQAKGEGRVLLTEIESKELLKSAGVRVVDTRLATSKEESISIPSRSASPWC